MSDRPGKRGGRLTPQRRRMLDHLLDRALEHLPEERPAFVARCQRRAPRLGFWLGRLLQATAEPTGFIDRNARHLAASALDERQLGPPTTLGQGLRMGPWRILERIGAGGMGEVYRAERADGAFEMQVAIKLIRSRQQDLARVLESERQLMARLNHPSIARLIDGGVADDARPYLVMEWVDGQTLERWVDDEGLSAERMLNVFAEVCSAVVHAHRSLVVHGDIKPANLAIDTHGQVKLLDFGIAQMLDADPDQAPPSAMTPGFSAPEQRRGEPISTASDIYSLGAFLHWLVHGCAPSASSPAGHPRAPWRDFARMKDVQAIIDRATASDPEQRYATVNGLMLEIQRLCDHYPVRTRPLSPPARLGLWMRRHTVAAALGGLAVLSLVVGLGGSVWQARIAAEERDIARHEAAVSLAVKDHLALLFREVSSLTEDAGELTARELLDETAEAAGEWMRDVPEARAEIQVVIAEILISLEDYASASELLDTIQAQFGDSGSDALRARLYRNQAMVLHRRGEIERGFDMADQAVGLIGGLSGDHAERLSDALQMRGRLRRERGDWEGALEDLSRARALAQDASEGPRPILARAEGNLAATYLLGGRLNEAVWHMEAAEALWYALGRGESPDALSNTHNLAVTLERLGRMDEAEMRFRNTIRVRRDRFGGSGALAAAKLQFARMLVVRGDFAEAETLLDNARSMMARYVGEQTPDYASTRIGLGELARARGDDETALEHFRAAETVFVERLGERHPYTLLARIERLLAAGRLGITEPGDGLAEIIDKLESSGESARSLLAHARCEAAVWWYQSERFEASSRQARACFELRQRLAFGGWRILEAQAIEALADHALGRADARDVAGAVLALEDEIGSQHSRYRWMVQAAGR